MQMGSRSRPKTNHAHFARFIAANQTHGSAILFEISLLGGSVARLGFRRKKHASALDGPPDAVETADDGERKSFHQDISEAVEDEPGCNGNADQETAGHHLCEAAAPD